MHKTYNLIDINEFKFHNKILEKDNFNNKIIKYW